MQTELLLGANMAIKITEDIRSITDLKRSTNSVLEQIHKTKRPVVLTVNGKAEAVLLDAKEYEKSYLDADIEKIVSYRSVFPTRHYSVIGRRDEILCERMRCYLEDGDAVAFVGAPHIPGITRMLGAEGYQIIGQYTP